MEIPDPQYVKTKDGVHIGYQVFGDGPDLVLNEGWMGNVDANWDLPNDDYPDFLRALARRFRLIVFDRRGFGISDRQASVSRRWAFEKSMKDLGAVMDAAGCDRALIARFWSRVATRLGAICGDIPGAHAWPDLAVAAGLLLALARLPVGLDGR